MDLKIFKSNEYINANDLKNKFINYDFYLQEKKDISLFHVNSIKEDVYHMVFKIDEELTTTSRYVKQINKMPLNIYINTFLYLDNNVICIENIYSEYFNLIIEELKSLINIEYFEYNFNQKKLVDIINNKSNRVLQCDFEIDESIVSYENMDKIKYSIENNEDIYYINLTPKIEEYKNVLISIKKNGEINIKANIPLVLIKLIKYLL
ncbi:hypothetical protein I9Y33_001356 [Clostridium perfringens]|nr:hypothetical protein [Clostridium perfringens]